MLKNLEKYKIILCSNSPRRRELLSGLGLNFEVRVIDGIDESYNNNNSCEEIAEEISVKKADAYLKTIGDNELIITADTIVYNNGEVLGKPHTREEAIDMLSAISGKTHKVVTGVCIASKNKKKIFSVSTNVKFSSLEMEEILFYIDNYSPYDKAGAYGIQEWIGYIGVEGIEGSYFNVMGLPIQRLYSELKKI
jgi:septum formation protein